MVLPPSPLLPPAGSCGQGLRLLNQPSCTAGKQGEPRGLVHFHLFQASRMSPTSAVSKQSPAPTFPPPPSYFPKVCTGTSLVAQGCRICLPMQETRVRSLVWEDPTYCRATKPWPQQLLSVCSRALRPPEPQLLNPPTLEPQPCNEGSHPNE